MRSEGVVVQHGVIKKYITLSVQVFLFYLLSFYSIYMFQLYCSQCINMLRRPTTKRKREGRSTVNSSCRLTPATTIFVWSRKDLVHKKAFAFWRPFQPPSLDRMCKCAAAGFKQGRHPASGRRRWFLKSHRPEILC